MAYHIAQSGDTAATAEIAYRFHFGRRRRIAGRRLTEAVAKADFELFRIAGSKHLSQ